MNLQDLTLTLLRFWDKKGCVIQQPYDVEMGAGTMHPETFLRVLGPEPYWVAYVAPSRRPQDSRYGENPYRVHKHQQCQVLLKPAPEDVQELFIESLRDLGIEPLQHDIRFEEDNWEAPTLGAWGVGWQVTLDGMEITQFTYFQQAGGIELAPIPVEITYGLERIAMFLNDKASMYDLNWSEKLLYGDIRLMEEQQFSRYVFDEADVQMHLSLFKMHRDETLRLIEIGLILPAFDHCLKCSHIFNVLDARGALSVNERFEYIAGVRKLACRCAEGYLKERERLEFPLLQRDHPCNNGEEDDVRPQR